MINTPLPKEELSILVAKLKTNFQTIVTALEKRTTKYSVTMYQLKDLNNGLICEQVKKANEGIEQNLSQLNYATKLSNSSSF